MTSLRRRQRLIKVAARRYDASVTISLQSSENDAGYLWTLYLRTYLQFHTNVQWIPICGIPAFTYATYSYGLYYFRHPITYHLYLYITCNKTSYCEMLSDSSHSTDAMRRIVGPLWDKTLQLRWCFVYYIAKTRTQNSSGKGQLNCMKIRVFYIAFIHDQLALLNV